MSLAGHHRASNSQRDRYDLPTNLRCLPMPHAYSSEAKLAEQQLRHAQAELAHISRVTTLGELTASIAHEINQPLTAVVTNAEAALRWLGAEPPNRKGEGWHIEWTRPARASAISSGPLREDTDHHDRKECRDGPPTDGS